MRIDILTLFPEVFGEFLNTTIVGRAKLSGVVEIFLHQIRDCSTDPHRGVDDRPFGGGPGMVMMCQPVFDCVEKIEPQNVVPSRKILLSPQGRLLNQRLVEELAGQPRLLLICGRYEGYDERIRIGLKAEEISIGDYVLSGGEPAAMVLIDAVVRLQNGALGDPQSAVSESFSHGLLEYPQYTRPRDFRGLQVPEILFSGNHKNIETWRREQSMRRTLERRPDLLKQDVGNPESQHVQ